MIGVPKALHDTLSFWLTLTGVVLAAKGRARAGGVLMLLVGIGGVGIGWERATGSRISGVRNHQLTKKEAAAVAWHVPIGLAGAALIHKTYRNDETAS